MRKTTWFVALTCALATLTATAQSTPTVAEKGRTLVSSNGSRLGTVYRVGPDGSANSPATSFPSSVRARKPPGAIRYPPVEYAVPPQLKGVAPGAEK